MSPIVASYGEWKSPIDVDFITSSTISSSELRKNEHTGELFWTEINSYTNGRQTIMTRSAEGVTSELTSAPFIARNLVHECGGGVFALARDYLVSSNDADCRLYKVNITSKETTPLTPENKAWRYADIAIHPSEKFLICVRVDHTVDTPQTVINTLVVVRLDTQEPNVQVLAEGADFYSAPRFNPANPLDFAYYSWSHPFMTWDHTQMYYNTLAITDSAITIASQTLLTGADKAHEESSNQPRFGSDGTLYFACDKTGFWNLYSYKAGGMVELVLKEPVKAEFQGPAWRFDDSSFYPLKSDPTKIASIYSLDVGSHNLPHQYISYNLRTSTSDVLMKSSSVEVPFGYISKPVPLTFKTTGGCDAYALFYPPANVEYVAPEGTLPPLRVLSHGGPTSAFVSDLNWSVNYFTSRGIACVTVNYGGSTNYGREFRDRLRTQWGVVDIDDCCNAAKYLLEKKLMDENKLAIVGRSAGGYSALAALAFRDVFKAGVSHFGIGDLEILAKDTHKLELLYAESLIGPYPAARDLYLERSPLYSADRITCPCAFFQGLDDKAEMMVDALKKRGLPVFYVTFEGEGHGFRIPKNVKTALLSEVTFLGRVFGFTPFDAIPIEIINEDAILR
ncbi:Dipeptidyl aminopeptidase [Mortierella antarctica]|nr:Dipeptidyl aminopeptidase [Mortierella antarctica]